MALSICDFKEVASEEAPTAGVGAPLPLIEPALVCPIGAVLSPLWLEGAVVVDGELVDWEPIPLEELAPT
jgi:hypothetical protein